MSTRRIASSSIGGGGGGSNVRYQTDETPGTVVGELWVDSDGTSNLVNSNDYLTKVDASAEYLSSISASNTYLSQDSASATYATQTSLTSGLASKLPYSYGTATPSTSDSGFLWYDSNITPPVPKFWDGSAFQSFPAGLTLVGQASLTGSAVSLNNVFSANYNAYRIVVRAVPSASADLQIRLRASGSDANGSDYVNQRLLIDDATITRSRTTNTTMALGVIAGRSLITLDIMSPHQTVPTNFLSQLSSNSTSQTLEMRASEHGLSTSYDGFSIFPSGTTFLTGNVRVYGYGQ